MAGGYDGSIRIDSRVDTKGFNKGIQSMGDSVKGLAAKIGIAFGVAAVVAFGKTAVDAAAKMTSALIGLNSVVTGTGGSFTRAQKFIESYIADGLVPATNAITAYKNLALRGYNTDQIEKTLTILKDSAAFGRQGSLTMGEAIQSASEGLKNENSILVDNAGITKNVAKMWDDYAKKIGTVAQNLTKQQKILAEVEGLTEESRFQTGDAAKLTETYSGKVAALGTSFYNLKVGFGNSIIPILSRLIPYIKVVVDWLVILMNQFARFMSLLLGVKTGTDAITASTGKAAESTEGLADATKKTGKAAKGALAAFDEINVLATDTAGGDGGGAGGGIPVPELTLPEETTAVLDEMVAKVEAFKEGLLVMLTPAIDALGRLRDAVIPLGETIWSGLKWAWDNIIVPFGTWVLVDTVPAFLDLLSAALKVVNEVLIALQPLGQWLWDNFLKPIAEWTGGVIITILEGLAGVLEKVATWISKNQAVVETIVIIYGALVIAAWLVNAALTAQTVIMGLALAAGGAFAAVMAIITSPVFLVVLAIAALIAIIVLLVKNWDWVKTKSTEVWEWIKEKWGVLGVWFSTNVVEPIKIGFKNGLEAIKTTWSNIFDGIKNIVKNSVNSIIGLINGMINAVVGGINSMIGALNMLKFTIPSWIPGVGGKSFALSIPTVTAPQIPYLASGAVIPPNSQFAAILGDQRSGKNLEAPEGLIRQIMQEELGKIETDVKIEFGGSMGALIRELKPRIDKESVRVGRSMVKAGA